VQNYLFNRKLNKIYRRIFNLTAGKSHLQSNRHDFSLDSGERQAGKTLDEIRYDHKVRYKFVINFLKNGNIHCNSDFGADIFCGTGYGTSMIASELSCSMLAIDGSEEAISFANNNFSSDQVYYTYKQFPFVLPPDIFDFIICFESLEHVEDGIHLMQELHSSLKDSGLLFLSTPNEHFLPFNKNFHKFHYKHYSDKEVRTLVNSTGHFECLTWLGQNLYNMNGGEIIGGLSDHQMNLHEKQEGQLLIYVFKKMEGV
jgi:SAM-dependent methyltransferase